MSHFQAVVTLKVKPESVEAARPHIVTLIEHARKEPGVVRYDWYSDAKEAGVFVVLEVFKDHAAFEAHRGSEHFKHIVEISKEWVSAPMEVRVLKEEYVHHAHCHGHEHK